MVLGPLNTLPATLLTQVASMPPVTAENFRRRVVAQQQESKVALERAAFSAQVGDVLPSGAVPAGDRLTLHPAQCDVCAKKFGTENAYKNHVESKKHKDRVKAVAQGRPGRTTSTSSTKSGRGWEGGLNHVNIAE